MAEESLRGDLSYFPAKQCATSNSTSNIPHWTGRQDLELKLKLKVALACAVERDADQFQFGHSQNTDEGLTHLGSILIGSGLHWKTELQGLGSAEKNEMFFFGFSCFYVCLVFL